MSQSPDIAQGVDAKAADGKETAEQGAGDQGLMFGYASNETPELMPAPIMFAHQLGRELTQSASRARSRGCPDAKSQVSVKYVDDQPVEITNVVISTQHAAESSTGDRGIFIENIIRKVLPKHLLSKKTQFLINPTGRFVVGGPQGDTGLTGRKIIVDSYGGMGRHGGGAFSGKDPSKWTAARHTWAAGSPRTSSRRGSPRARKSSLPMPSVIRNLSAFASTPSARRLKASRIPRLKTRCARCSAFKPANIVKQLNLLRPIYRKTTNYGHFGKNDPDITWEKTDKVKALQRALKLN